MNVNDQTRTYDLAVVGAGSAAKVAATEARRLGKSVVMIERSAPGGTCLNVGCVPSKMLLAAAASRASALKNSFPGVETLAGPVDLALLVKDKDHMIAHLGEEDHVKGTMRAGIDLLQGTASFEPSGAGDFVALTVTGREGDTIRITADQALIATGAQPFVPDIPGLTEIGYLTSSTAMALESVPASLLVLGGNAIGLEQAQLFARLGSMVTVIELAPRIAPFEDPDLSASLMQALTEDGIEFHTGANLVHVRQSGSDVIATIIIDGETVELSAEKLLIATGRRPETQGLNLQAVGIETGPRGEVPVNEYLRTTNPRIWAAGDVTGQRQFVYVAGAQGATAVSNAFGDTPGTLDYSALPRVTFTSPALASVGLTPAEAVAAKQAYETRELPMALVPRAAVSRHTAGLLKLVSEPTTGKILGVHMVGQEAGEVITAATYAISAGFTLQQLATTWAPFLTMAESLRIIAQLPSAASDFRPT